MENLARQLDQLTARIIEEDWPTTAAEHRAWAARVGLPTDGEPVPPGDDDVPGSRTWRADGFGGRVYWDFFRDELVGVQVIVSMEGTDVAEPLRTSAAELRAALDARWPAAEAQQNAAGSMSLWQPVGRDVELYWDTPLDDGLVLRQASTLHLAISHAQRSAALDEAAQVMARDAARGQ